jgi:predicted HD phosphohydrolase
MIIRSPNPPAPFADLAEIEIFLEGMANRPGEAPGLSELDHGLQCAETLSRVAPDDKALQIAGLVHDICHGQCPIADHARVSADAVRPVLGERIAALVGLHVDAKRYLVATDPTYGERLSPVSVQTLALQGGPMDEAEARAFEANPHARDAISLRMADEEAKVVGMKVAGLDTWLPLLRAIAAPH